jgi:hypothetical protein
MSRILAIALLLVATLLAAAVPGNARAAPSYDACDYFIDVLPATVTVPGTWCLTGNLTTSADGNAVEITADDVTLDCNGFRIDGTSRVQTVLAQGIVAPDRLNVTVRNCHVRGFTTGISLTSGSGVAEVGLHTVEDCRVERNGSQGIVVTGDGSVVRRNLVLETANDVSQQGAFGITAYGDVDILDNLVSGVRSRNGVAGGIWTGRTKGSSVRGNLVRGVRRNGTVGGNYALFNSYEGTRMIIRDNTFVGEQLPASTGIHCDLQTNHAKGNTIVGFVNGRVGCVDDGNIIKP